MAAKRQGKMTSLFFDSSLAKTTQNEMEWRLLEMKKILASILAIIMIMAIAACGGGNNAPQTSSTPTTSPNQNQGTSPSPTPNPSENPRPVQTGSDIAPREFSFRIYNESNYDIYSIHMGPLEGSAEDDLDILDSILVSGDDVLVSGTVPGHLASVTQWTLFVTDVDDDTSLSYDVFDPFSLSYVDVVWDSDSAGYRCDFVY